MKWKSQASYGYESIKNKWLQFCSYFIKILVVVDTLKKKQNISSTTWIVTWNPCGNIKWETVTLRLTFEKDLYIKLILFYELKFPDRSHVLETRTVLKRAACPQVNMRMSGYCIFTVVMNMSFQQPLDTTYISEY
jgi:hypothetical protein